MKKGYQLFSALELCQSAEGLLDTIRRIGEMGYDGVEFFDYAGVPAAQLRAALREAGLEGFNSHVSLDRWQNDLDAEIAYAVEAGIPMLTVPYIAPELRNATTYARLAAELPGYADRCEAAGLTVGYHNHDFEFAPWDGGILLDTLLAVDARVRLELDTFWAMYAGRDPVACMKEYSGRLAIIHVKDYLDRTVQPPVFCAIGTGKMENAPVVRQARDLALGWVVVEQDNSQIDVLESARLSLEGLRALGL